MDCIMHQEQWFPVGLGSYRCYCSILPVIVRFGTGTVLQKQEIVAESQCWQFPISEIPESEIPEFVHTQKKECSVHSVWLSKGQSHAVRIA